MCRNPVEIDWSAVENGLFGPEDLFKGWAQDRYRLVQCKRSNDALIIYVEDIRTGLMEDLRVDYDPSEVLTVSHTRM